MKSIANIAALTLLVLLCSALALGAPVTKVRLSGTLRVDELSLLGKLRTAAGAEYDEQVARRLWEVSERMTGEAVNPELR